MKAMLLLWIGKTYAVISEYENSIQYLNQAKEIFEELKESFLVAKTLLHSGDIYINLANFKESMSCLLSALEIYEQNSKLLQNDKNKLYNIDYGDVLIALGNLYSKLTQPGKSRNYLQQAYELFEKIKDSGGMIKALSGISVTLMNDDIEKSLEYQKRALKIAEDFGNKNYVSYISGNIGSIYLKINDFNNALKYYKIGLNITKETGNKKIEAVTKLNMGYAYEQLNNEKSALQYLQESLKIAQKFKFELVIQNIYNALSDIFKKKADYKTALEYHEKYSETKDKILNKEMINKISNLQKKYEETSKKLLETKKHNSLISVALKKSINMNFVGESKKIRKVLDLAMTAAANKDANVLITGETGTGKEIIANIIHYASARKNNLFVAVNTSSVPESLAESEFFGYIKGAFTGAINDKTGYLEYANKGTLFLDEIADTPPQLQAKLLRVLDNKKIKHIGSNKEIQVDFRIISATNKDVDELIKNNKFRMDLLYRLNTIEINIPPLRERPADIKPLLFSFVQEFSKSLNKPMPKINSALVDKLKKYHFPGNVRELKNMIERAIIIMNSDTLEPEHFDTRTINELETSSVEIIKYKTIDKMEKQMIIDALKETNNNRTRAARLLGISHSTLLRKLKKIEE